MSHVLHTHLHLKMDLAGSLERISNTIGSGSSIMRKLRFDRITAVVVVVVPPFPFMVIGFRFRE